MMKLTQILSLVFAAVILAGCNESLKLDLAPTKSNTPPIAIAGNNQLVYVGEPTQLNGEKSFDKDLQPLTFEWKIQPDQYTKLDRNAKLLQPNSIKPSFVANETGEFYIDLTVNDGIENSRVNTVKITAVIKGENSPPVISLAEYISGSLLGAAIYPNYEDADNDELFYTWEILEKPINSSPVVETLSAAYGWGALNTDMEGDYVVKLTVFDGTHYVSAITTVQIRYKNIKPVANLNHDVMISHVGRAITLDGTKSSDLNGESLNFHWTMTPPNGSNATFDDPHSPTPTILGDVPGLYFYELVVDDGELSSDPNEYVIEFLGPDTPGLRIYRDTSSAPLDMPHRPEQARDETQNNQASYVLDRYRIEAVESDVYIRDVVANDRANIITPYFDGLEQTQLFTLKKGESISFNLVAPATDGKVSQPIFSFNWIMGRATEYHNAYHFDAKYTFTSN
ncbi:PKD domain-containing protein [Vibrio nigripulchritudo]|uniref:PKD domain-containing protein n=2 Tax=Vibrio nigripulchritudo TaxID=28173 RepID=U4KAL8_9VIBR|nr:hypothetical protein [Vibrio nigripulchritudo]CCO59830.1 hypothetical protein VIBNI_A3880 [Vibrio nigripulchritudo]